MKRMRSKKAKDPRKAKKKAKQTHGSATPGFGHVASTPMQLSMVPRNVGSVHVISPFPPAMKKTLRYVDKVQILTNTAAAVGRFWKINSLYDFDGSTTGHQPRYFDQFCTASGPYLKYRVLGVRITVECCSDPSHNAVPVIFAAGFNTTQTLPTFPSGSVVANPYTTGELPGWTSLIQDAYSGTRKMNFQRTVANVLGLKDSQIMSEDNYAAAYNADPTDIAYFQVIAMNAGDNGSVSDAEIGISCEFDVQFESPPAILWS